MKDNKDFFSINKRVEDILKKRYAVEKVFQSNEVILVSLLFFSAILLSGIFWIVLPSIVRYELGSFMHLIPISIISISVVIGVIWYLIWDKTNIILPKFIMVGLIGWAFLGSEMITNLLVSSNWEIQEKAVKKLGDKQLDKEGFASINLPVERLLSINEIPESKICDLSNPKEVRTSLVNVLKFMNSPYYYTRGAKNIYKEYLFFWFLIIFFFVFMIILTSSYRRGSDNDGIAQKKLPILKRFEFFIILLLFFPFSVFLYLYTNKFIGGISILVIVFFLIFIRDRLPWKIRDVIVEVSFFAILTIGTILFFFTYNYFILFSLLFTTVNVLLFKWEISKRGVNHKLWSRSILSSLMTQMFAGISGAAYFIIFIPVFIFMRKGFAFCTYDAGVLIWVIILGSSISVFIGLVTQLLLEGSRLTEKLSK